MSKNLSNHHDEEEEDEGEEEVGDEEEEDEEIIQDVPNNSMRCDCSTDSLFSDDEFVGCPFLDCHKEVHKTSTCIDDLIQNFINDDEVLNCCNNDSPLPLYSKTALPRKGKLEFTDMEKHPKRITMENNGNTVELSFLWGDDSPPTVKGGPLNSLYIFDQLHYHWGSVNGQGSEHIIDDFRYEMEIHLIFYNSRYGHFEEAKTRTEGLVILAFLVEVSPFAVTIPFIKQLRKISNCGSRVTINEERFNLLRIIGNENFSFFCYESNLIKPNCNDTITWIVANFFNKIQPAELEIFRLLLNIYDNKVSDNFRELKTKKTTNIYLYSEPNLE